MQAVLPSCRAALRGSRGPLQSVYSLVSASRVLSPKPQPSLSLNSSFHLSSVMTIKVGDQIPCAELYEDTPANKINIAEYVKSKKVVLFAVPGAFTPGCSKTHLPGYLADADKIKSKGICEIICISVNDPFVMAAWGKDQNVNGKIKLLADPAAAFTKAIGLDTDIPPLGGTRSKRYSMVVDDGKVTQLNIEPDGTGLSCSLSKSLDV